MSPRLRYSIRVLALASLPVLAAQGRAQATFRRSFSLPPVKYSGIVWPDDKGSSKPANAEKPSPVFIGPAWGPIDSTVDAYADLIVPAIDFGLFTTPSINLGKTGFQLKYGGAGKVGFLFTPSYDGGDMSLSYNGSITIDGLPSAPSGNPASPATVTLKLSAGAGPSSKFTTTSPTFGIGVDSVFDITGNASLSGWFLDQPVVTDKSLFDSGKLGKPNGGGTVARHLIDQKDLTSLTVGEFNNAIAAVSTIVSNATVLKAIPGVSVSLPDLTVENDTVNTSTGVLTGTTFSPFLNVDFNITQLMLSLVPGAPFTAAGLLLDGAVTVPTDAGGATVGWDFAKLYGDFNLGCRSTYTVRPVAKVDLTVTPVNADGSEGRPLSLKRSGDSFTFTMPNGPIRIRPTATVNLSLDSSLIMELRGEIGTSPAAFRLDGGIGKGDRAQTYHLNVDPAHAAYDFPYPEANGKIMTGTRNVGSATLSANAITIYPKNTTDFSPYIFPDDADNKTVEDNPPLAMDAYKVDKEADNKPVHIVRFNALSSGTLMPGDRPVTVTTQVEELSGQVVDGIRPRDAYVAMDYSRNVSRLFMTFDSAQLKPGRYSLHTHLKNDAGKSGDYTTPLNINYQKGILSGQFYQGEGDKAVTINSIPANGRDQTIHVQVQHLYSDTEVVLNGSVVLPRAPTADIPTSIRDSQTLTFTVPAAVASRFAGQKNIIQLRTRDLSGNGSDGGKPDGSNPGTGYLLSDFETRDNDTLGDLYVLVDRPTLTGTKYQNDESDPSKIVLNGPLPLAQEDVGFEIDGTNFSMATKLHLVATFDGQTSDTVVDSTYLSPNAMRVTVPGGYLSYFHVHSSDAVLRAYAETPFSYVPDRDYPSTGRPNGGTSGLLKINLLHRTPTITRFEPAILIKDGGAQTVKVYGDNLLRIGKYDQADLAKGFGAGATVAYPGDGMFVVPYVLVTFPANSPFVTTVGTREATVGYRDVRSVPNSLLTEYAAPKINTDETYRVVMGSAGGTLRMFGGAFYQGKDATKLLVNSDVYASTVLGPPVITAQLPASIPGASAMVKVVNSAPGGGESNEVKVLLLESDPKTVKAVPGPLVYDRLAGTYRQSYTVTYSGSRDVSSGAQIVFDGLPSGITLVNSAGTSGGAPYLWITPAIGRAVNLVAVWRKTGAAAIPGSTHAVFPY